MTGAPNKILAFRVAADCQGERRAHGIDFSIRAKAKQDRAQRDAWDGFTASCKRVMNAAPEDAPDPREQMFLFIKDMKP